jgi:hypothetical protein
MANMFDKIAKTTTTKRTTKKNDKPIIKIQGEEFDNNLKSFVNLKKQADEIKSQLTLIQDFIKTETLNKWYTLYKTNGSYPGSVLVTSDSNSSYMFSPSDKYLSVSDERSEELKDKYGDDIVDEDITFAFNPTLLMKYADILSNLIENSDEIEEEDKGNLIIANKTISISKGSIEKALTVGKGEVEEYLEDINPIYTIRSPKISE